MNELLTIRRQVQALKRSMGNKAFGKALAFQIAYARRRSGNKAAR